MKIRIAMFILSIKVALVGFCFTAMAEIAPVPRSRIVNYNTATDSGGKQIPSGEEPPSTNSATSGTKTLSESKLEEIKNKITAAVEEVLMLYGNPPFAEIITNDPGRASEIRRRLAIVKDADAIKAEITALTDKKENLLAQIALRETELNKARLDLGRLRQLIDQTIDTLKTAQTSMEEGTKSE